MKFRIFPLIVAISAFAMSACTQPGEVVPADITHLSPSGNDHAIVVVGVSLANRSSWLIQKCFEDYGLIAIDPRTKGRVGDLLTRRCEMCGILATHTNACNGGADYAAYELPAGSYAFGYLLYDQIALSLADFKDLRVWYANGAVYRRDVSSEARLAPGTPRVSVRPGEVVYVGDIVFDFSNKKDIRWSIRNNEAGARGFLEGTDLARRMVSRPWTRTGP